MLERSENEQLPIPEQARSNLQGPDSEQLSVKSRQNAHPVDAAGPENHLVKNSACFRGPQKVHNLGGVWWGIDASSHNHAASAVALDVNVAWRKRGLKKKWRIYVCK